MQSDFLVLKYIIMPELTAKLFRDYFGGSWLGRITKNGEFQREIVFSWPAPFGKFSSLGTEEGMMTPPGCCVQDNTRQIAIAGWRNDVRRWCSHWYNEFGGYGELQWISQEIENGVTVLYGSLHECKQESDDTTDHIAMCELFDHDNFKYTTQSFRKGLLEIVATRIRTGEELNTLLEKQANTALSFAEVSKILQREKASVKI